MKRVTYSGLLLTLMNNVCEISFLRRHPITDRPDFRRMICTNSYSLLNSFNGKMVLAYRPPRQLPNFNPQQKNLIITWDILMIDYRCINMDECYLIKSYPANDTFWKHLNENIYTMSTLDKMVYMDS